MTNTLAVMNRDGHLPVSWETDNEEQVAEARAAYDRAKAEGYAAYRMEANGMAGELIREFDPNAQSIVMRPQMRAG